MPVANGREIRRRRVAKGWTQEELSVQTRLAKRTIENAEKGEVVSLHSLSRLSLAFVCTPQDLVVAERPTSLDEHLTCLYPLQEKLCQKFTLRQSVVVDLSAIRGHLPQAASAVYDSDDGFIHVALGCGAARVVGSLLSGGRTIGVGGGRTPKSCVHYLGGLKSLPTCKVLSLSGHVSTHLHRGAIPFPHDEHTDADGIASILGSVLHDGPVTRVNSPLAGKSSNVNRRPKLPSDAVVLIGAGILTPAHPLGQYEGNSDLEVIASDLKELHSIIKGVPAASVMIGDVCNYLFRVLPSGKSAFQKKIDRVLGRINSRTVTLRLDDLAKVCQCGHVVLVAGGWKAPVMKHLLQQSPPCITHLVTDDFAANRLLSDLDE